MTKRSNRPVLTERRGDKEAKLQALKQAANQGWSEITAGRYTDVSDDRLEDLIEQLRHSKRPAKYPGPDASTKSIPSAPSKGIPAKVVSEGRSAAKAGGVLSLRQFDAEGPN